ncbi:hypothetical protein ACE38W_01335 [Chitinophaga sp. Hz27]|uniref:hypothetical protein n=1 Tax=Chitinophaga sp. Hz27 TaxID=3347169 RepID=UPI0035DBB751
MSIHEPSILDDILETTQQKRRWHMLPLLSRILIVFGTICGGLLSSLLLFGIVYNCFVNLYPPAVLNSVQFSLCLTAIYFLGNLLLWMEKRLAISWGKASYFAALLISVGIAKSFSAGPITFMIIILPFLIIIAYQTFILFRVSHQWKNQSISRRQELK